MKLLPHVAAAVTLLSIGGQNLSAQVTINEVNFTPGSQWIELFNAGSSPVNLGSWSIYHATKTPNRFGDYWWGFPSSTSLAAKGYLRINWGQPIPASPPANTLFTGDSSWNFLFGHGYEAIDPDDGAIAICKTQDNRLVNDANIFSDWWQWGQPGFKREDLATGNKPVALWPVNTAYPKVPAGASLMVVDIANGFPHSLASLQNDFTPTPLAHNTEGMAEATEGTPCNQNSLDPAIGTTGFAFYGNKDFGLVTKNTRGPAFFEVMFYTFRLDKQFFSFVGCHEVLLFTGLAVTTPLFPTTINQTTLPIPLTDSSVRGATVYIQSVVASPTSFAFTNLLKLTISK